MVLKANKDTNKRPDLLPVHDDEKEAETRQRRHCHFVWLQSLGCIDGLSH